MRGAIEPGLRQRHSAAAVGEEGRVEQSSSPGRWGKWGGGNGEAAGWGWGRVVLVLKRRHWKLRQRRWWCWDHALCCCHLWAEKGNDHLGKRSLQGELPLKANIKVSTSPQVRVSSTYGIQHKLILRIGDK